MMKKILILALVLILHQLSFLQPSFSANIARFTVTPTSISLPEQDPETFRPDFQIRLRSSERFQQGCYLIH